MEDILKLLHPFMPFLSEELWQEIESRTTEQALIVSVYPELTEYNQDIITSFEHVSEVISGIRTIRKNNNISFKDTIELHIVSAKPEHKSFDRVVAKLGNISAITYTDSQVKGALSFRVKSDEYFVPMGGNINVEEELAKLSEELKYTEGFLKSVDKKLSNERFVSNAPAKVIEIENNKRNDAIAKIETIKASIEALS